ncbi:MAG: AAA family ATPase [Armatimonadetes bacterium]|nr:AAA family ATPase [Armatimonadota bacterium]
MRVTRIEIEGYRSIKGPLVWDLAPLNVLIGPNAGGKSNLLRCLELLQLLAEGKLADAVQREGGMGAMVWDGRVDAIGVGIGFDGVAGLGGSFDDSPHDCEYSVVLGRVGGSAYAIDLEELATTNVVGGPVEERTVLMHRDPSATTIRGRLVNLPDSGRRRGETILSQLMDPFDENGLSVQATELFPWSVHREIRVGSESPVRAAPVVRYETSLTADGQNLVAVLHTHYTRRRDFKELLDNAMLAAFGEEYEELVFTPVASQRIELGLRWRSLREVQPAASLSDGTLRFLALLTILGAPEPAPLIAIDEPETGLHPGMFAIIAEQAVAASERSTVILTTHSPQFLDAFESPPVTSFVLNRGGETQLAVPSPEKLSYWLEQYSLGDLAFSWDAEELA